MLLTGLTFSAIWTRTIEIKLRAIVMRMKRSRTLSWISPEAAPAPAPPTIYLGVPHQQQPEEQASVSVKRPTKRADTNREAGPCPGPGPARKVPGAKAETGP